VPAQDHRDHDYRGGDQREQHPLYALASPMLLKINSWKTFSAEQI
jgi:hypothetical protein